MAISSVAGMGGVGKTELAIQYARRYQSNYPGGICWLRARESKLATEILQFAQLYLNLEIPQERAGRLLNPNEQVDWCWDNWQPLEGLVLVVLDDVTNLASCLELQPKSNRFRILITTRLRSLDSNYVEISLDVLSPLKAFQLLTFLLGEKDRRIEKEQQTAELLCERLGYLPLGLELVGRYLVEDPDLSLAEMLKRLEAQKLDNEAIDPSEEQLQQTAITAKRGVRAAFELSWQELNPLTQRVGQLLSLFASDVFHWQWVESATELLNWSQSEVDEAKKQLYKRHLIQRLEDKAECYKIHPLIREFLQAKLAVSEQSIRLKWAFAQVMVEIARQIFPKHLLREDIEIVKYAIPHIAEVAQNMTDVVSNEDLIMPFMGLSKFYDSQGLYTLAGRWYEHCLPLAEKRLGKNHYQISYILNNLAIIYCYQARYEDANILYQRDLELTKEIFGENSFDYAKTLNNIANFHYKLGDYLQAESLAQKSLNLRHFLGGEKHPDAYSSWITLANISHDKGNDDKAESCLKKALFLTKYLPENKHLFIAHAWQSLGLVYSSNRELKKAECYYKKALKKYVELLGEENIYVAQTLQNLLILYKNIEDYELVEVLMEEAFQQEKKILGEQHSDLAIIFNNRGTLYLEQNKYVEAEAMIKKSIELTPKNHPNLAERQFNLALIYHAQKQYNKAKKIYKIALKNSQESLGNNHHTTLRINHNLAVLEKNISDSNSLIHRFKNYLLTLLTQ